MSLPEPKRWTPKQLAKLFRAKHQKCAACSGLIWECPCRRTTKDLALWLEQMAEALREAGEFEEPPR